MNANIEQVVDQIKKEENIIHKAKLLRYLTVDKGIRIKDVSHMIGMKQSYVCHILRLNKLSDMIVDGYYSKMISISHLFIISRLHTEEEIRLAYEKVLFDNLTVGQTEELIRELLYKTKTIGDHLPKEEVTRARGALETLDSKVSLKVIQTRVKSRILIEVKGSLADTTPVLKQIVEKLALPQSEKK